jgi:hypothetical protein
MNKIFSLTVTILLGALICSCSLVKDASFNPPDAPSPWFYTMQTFDIHDAEVHPDNMGGPPNISKNAHIVVGWEIPNNSGGHALYIFGDTAIVSGFGKYKYSLHIGDSLPKFVVSISSIDTIAVAHFFVTVDPLLRNGDTILYSNCWMNSEISGALDGEVIVFRKGNATITNGITLTDYYDGFPGYNILHCDCIDGSNFNAFSVKPDYNPKPDIFMDDRTDEIRLQNPFWLQ